MFRVECQIDDRWELLGVFNDVKTSLLVCDKHFRETNIPTRIVILIKELA